MEFFYPSRRLGISSREACISPTKADLRLPLLYLITRTRVFRIPLRLDDIHGYAVMIYRNKLRMIYTPYGVIVVSWTVTEAYDHTPSCRLLPYLFHYSKPSWLHSSRLRKHFLNHLYDSFTIKCFFLKKKGLSESLSPGLCFTSA